MHPRPILESLESRDLLSGSSLLDADVVSHPADQQVESAYAIVNASGIPTTTYAPANIAIQSATTSATHFMSAFESSAMPPAPTGPPTVSMHGPLIVAPKIYGNTGNIVAPQTPPEVHTSDENPEPATKATGRPTSMNQPADPKASDAMAPREHDAAKGKDRADLPATPQVSPWSALDSCFALEAWSLPFEDAFDGPCDGGQSNDVELLFAAAGTAAAVQFAHADAPTRSAAENQSRRRLGGNPQQPR